MGHWEGRNLGVEERGEPETGGLVGHVEVGKVKERHVVKGVFEI